MPVPAALPPDAEIEERGDRVPAAAPTRNVLWQIELLAAAIVALVYLLAPRSQPSAELVRTAEDRGRALFELERAWGLDVEAGLQDLVGALHLQVPANWLYGSLHFVVTAFAFVSLLRRRPALYARWRTAFVAASLVGFAVQTWWPVAPPRLVAGIDGTPLLADWLAQHPALWSFESGPISAVANHYSAMPSMHVGWAVLSAWALGVGRGTWGRRLAWSYPALVAVVVVVTGNHFLLDVLAGVLVAAAGLAVVLWRTRTTRRRVERRDLASGDGRGADEVPDGAARPRAHPCAGS